MNAWSKISAFSYTRYFCWAFIAALWAATLSVTAAERRPHQPSTKVHLHFDSAVAKRYRTILTKEAALGSNFEDHLRVAVWGCGTSCMYWAVIDLSNGQIWTSPMDACAQPRIDQEGDIHWLDIETDAPLIRTYSCIPRECTDDASLMFKTYLWADGRAILVSSGCTPSK